jgi:hypothetical protein
MALDILAGWVFNAAWVFGASVGWVFSAPVGCLFTSAGWVFAVDPEVVTQASLRLRAVCFVRDME